MKTLILSPLFPPDTGAPADYVKELATRLSGSHDVQLLIYGYLPEEVVGVSITSVDKRALLPVRIARFTKSLLGLGVGQDLVLVNNGPSVELPFFIISLFKNIPFILIESDEVASKASKRGWYKIIHAQILKRAKKVISLEKNIYKKAERLPFAEFDVAQEARREAWWSNHCNQFTS